MKTLARPCSSTKLVGVLGGSRPGVWRGAISHSTPNNHKVGINDIFDITKEDRRALLPFLVHEQTELA